MAAEAAGKVSPGGGGFCEAADESQNSEIIDQDFKITRQHAIILR